MKIDVNGNILSIQCIHIFITVYLRNSIDVHKDIRWHLAEKESATYMVLQSLETVFLAKERVGGEGGANENFWILFYRCAELKKIFQYVPAPGGK